MSVYGLCVSLIPEGGCISICDGYLFPHIVIRSATAYLVLKPHIARIIIIINVCLFMYIWSHVSSSSIPYSIILGKIMLLQSWCMAKRIEQNMDVIWWHRGHAISVVNSLAKSFIEIEWYMKFMWACLGIMLTRAPNQYCLGGLTNYYLWDQAARCVKAKLILSIH